MEIQAAKSSFRAHASPKGRQRSWTHGPCFLDRSWRYDSFSKLLSPPNLNELNPESMFSKNVDSSEIIFFLSIAPWSPSGRIGPDRGLWAPWAPEASEQSPCTVENAMTLELLRKCKTLCFVVTLVPIGWVHCTLSQQSADPNGPSGPKRSLQGLAL